MERNPIAAIRNNALGTNILAQSAQEHRAETLTMVSIDKAVNARSVMGASKRLAELALVRWGAGETRMRSVRLGNVLGTHGSVVRVFVEQILAGGPITVTHPDATRYFLTLPEAVDLILMAAELPGSSGILIPDLGEPVKIIDLAYRMIKEAGCDPQARIPIVFIGLRPGDKIAEDLASDSEFVESTTDSRLSRLRGSEIPAERFDSYMEHLKSAVDQYDLGVMFDTLRRMLPEYEPSECVLRSLEGASA
jgi:FlaA1/EpsC-like NDP-sugar epimerase